MYEKWCRYTEKNKHIFVHGIGINLSKHEINGKKVTQKRQNYIIFSPTCIKMSNMVLKGTTQDLESITVKTQDKRRKHYGYYLKPKTSRQPLMNISCKRKKEKKSVANLVSH